MSVKRIERLLKNALLKEGKMVYALYKYELEKNLGDWILSMEKDGDDFIFTVTEHSNDVAMALLHKTDGLYVNEDARRKLQALWRDQYANNIEKMILLWAEELAADSLPLMGVKFQ